MMTRWCTIQYKYMGPTTSGTKTMKFYSRFIILLSAKVRIPEMLIYWKIRGKLNE